MLAAIGGLPLVAHLGKVTPMDSVAELSLEELVARVRRPQGRVSFEIGGSQRAEEPELPRLQGDKLLPCGTELSVYERLVVAALLVVDTVRQIEIDNARTQNSPAAIGLSLVVGGCRFGAEYGRRSDSEQPASKRLRHEGNTNSREHLGASSRRGW